MRELYVNGAYVRYETNADLSVLLQAEIRGARRARHGHHLEKLERQRRDARQLHERPGKSRFAK